MAHPGAGFEIFDESEPLQRQIDRIMQTVEPLARQHGVNVLIDLTPRAKSLPALTLGPVILNGLRNAIEACAATDSDERRVELSIFVNQVDQLVILVTDTGCGPQDEDGPKAGASTKPGGHGFGLDLSRRIVHELGGQLRLSSVPFGRGAILQAMIPMQCLSVR
jgi:signal transduction histidine kinase